jgi:succinylglutamic semialdehyde dehydrogenase
VVKDATMSGTLTSHSPVDDRVVGELPIASGAEVERAFLRARASQPMWAALPQTDRDAIARGYAERLKQHREPLARLIADETGKVLWEARQEVDTAVAKVEASIAALYERRAPVRPSGTPTASAIRFRAVGTLLVLGPFNFPLHLPGSHLVPALLAGNAAVFKPSDQAPVIGARMVELWHEAGVPPDALSVLQGGVDIAQQALAQPSLDGVLLTGSYRTAQAVQRALVDRPEVLIAMELGGNNPLVVARPGDPRAAAAVVCQSAFATAGQRCTCARRLIVVDEPAGRATVQAVRDLLQHVQCGLPDAQPEPFAGTLISRTAADQVAAGYQRWLEAGAQPIVGLRRSTEHPALLQPALVDATGCELGDAELFGPVLQVHWVPDFERAIELANRTRYGLSAALLSERPDEFERFAAGVRAGVVNWNRATTGASGRLPFGGLGCSGNHRPSAYYACDYASDPVACLEAPPLRQPTPDLPAPLSAALQRLTRP